MSKEKFDKIKRICIVIILAIFIVDKGCEFFFSEKPEEIIQFYDLPDENTLEINDNGFKGGANESIIDNSNDISKSIDSELMIYTDEAPEDFLIDINSATSEQLQVLYRIGPALAQKIIEYRDSYGYFATIEEIKEVSGIGDKTYEKIKDYIKAEQ